VSRKPTESIEIEPAQGAGSGRDLVLSLVLLAFALILLLWLIPSYIAEYTTGDQGLSPRFFPYLISLTIGLFSLLLFGRTVRGKKILPATPMEKTIDRSKIICIILLVAYQQAIELIGLAPASFLALVGLMVLYGFSNWLVIGFFSAALVTLLSLFFENVAQVPLPRGILFEGWY
jgi:hypothetical protein